MSYTYIIILFTTAVFIITSCSESTERLPPNTPSEVLNKKVSSAPYQFIDLDEAELKEIVLSDEDIIFSVIGNDSDEEPLLGDISSVVYYDDRFLIYDRATRAVYNLNIVNNNLEGPLTREGSGPGEYEASYFTRITSNSKNIFLADLLNARIHQYSFNMEPETTFQKQLYTPGIIEVSNKQLLMQNPGASGFVPEHSGQGLIAVYSIDNIDDTLSTIMPRIIPGGYQPQVYNSPAFSINHHNWIAAMYRPLPWIFLFDENLNHMHTLILESAIFDKMNIPEMDFFRPTEGEGFGGSNPFSSFRLMDDGDIFITMAGKLDESDLSTDQSGVVSRVLERVLIHLSLSADGRYQIAGKYTFKHLEITEFEWGPESMPFPTENDKDYFAHNRDYIFRFSLSN
ncbi:MAG: 6-bladed beta-propeller [Cyclonatronaceae bacterium]